ncbi:TPA: hypothetical protein ACYERP_003392 [Klebsiella pneumoniae]
MAQITDERLVKILSETQATIMEHNSRCVRGSVEVDARLFESMIMELQVRRKAAEGYKNLNEMEQRAEQAECLIMCLDDLGVPDTEGSESLSLWGRVKIFAEENSKDRAELQERRKADSEPVAEVVSIYGAPEAFGEREIRPLVGIQQMPYGTKLYRHAQPAPVVPDDVLAALQKVARIRLDMNDFDGDRRGIADCLVDAEEALIEVVNRRAAMLQAGTFTNEGTIQVVNSPAVPDGYVMVPKEPTREILDEFDSIIDYGAEGSVDAWRRLLASAPQEVKGE